MFVHFICSLIFSFSFSAPFWGLERGQIEFKKLFSIADSFIGLIWFRNATNGLWTVFWFASISQGLVFKLGPNLVNCKTKPFKTITNPSKPLKTICCISKSDFLLV